LFTALLPVESAIGPVISSVLLVTTIAVSRSLLMMAADGAVRMGSTRVPKSPKMWRHKDCIVGIAGDLRAGEMFSEWLVHRAGNRPAGEYDALVLYRDGRISWWTGKHKETFIKEDFYSIGSGSDFAMGALEAMADLGLPIDPRCAVRSAIKRDAFSEEPVHTLRWIKK
jgi:ATP-dependent protease HslVU (ClpYQ) peptidase subunit